MNRSVLHILLALGLMTYSGCTSKDAKDELASPAGEELGENDAAVFDELSEDEFFATAEEPGLFDNDAPAEALGEVPPLEETPMAETEGFADDGAFAAVDPAADPGADFNESADPFAAEGGSDPFAAEGGADPFAAEGGADPFADLAQSEGVTDSTADPFASSDAVDPMVAEEPVPTDIAAPLGDGFFEDAPSTDLVASTSSDDSESGDSNSSSGLVPVKKIKDTPFRSAGQLLNAVYIVRPDDTIESVSQKIYGSDRSSEILAANPHLNRSFKPGDKLYYNSPNRPNDESQLLTFYADQGTPAQSYVSQDGDNIRTVSNDLLGFEGAWKEVWATNPNVESKWLLNAGVELKYWKGGGGVSTPKLARNDVGSMPTPAPMPVADAPEFEEPALPAEPPMDNNMAANDFPPPSGEDFQEPDMADFDSLPPPSAEDFSEPPSEDLALSDLPPPPPPPPAFRDQGPASLDDATKNVANADDASDDPLAMLGAMDDDMMMLGGALAVIILGGGILMVIRKRKARDSELEDALSDSTQVG